MELGQTALSILAGVLMVIGIFISFVPFVPGTILLWVVAVVYAALTNFAVVTPLGMLIITVLAIIGATKDFWTPFLGMKTHGASCSSIFGTIIGGLIGTFVIPIPIVGTLIGAILGAMALEAMRLGDLRRAMQAGSLAFEAFVYGIIVEFLVNLMIVGVFFFMLLA